MLRGGSVNSFTTTSNQSSLKTKKNYTPEATINVSDGFMNAVKRCTTLRRGMKNSGSTACPIPKVVRKWWLEDHPYRLYE